jgi:hypothetical protein
MSSDSDDQDWLEDKNWVRRHWVISIFLGIFILGIIGAAFNEGDSGATGNAIQEKYTEKTTSNVEYADTDLDTLILDFVSDYSTYTELQKEEEFKKYKGKILKGSGLVKEVDTVMLSDSLVVRIINPENQYLTGATIYFDESQKSKLLAVEEYDEINFEGEISDYGSLMGIIIRKAKVV